MSISQPNIGSGSVEQAIANMIQKHNETHMKVMQLNRYKRMYGFMDKDKKQTDYQMSDFYPPLRKLNISFLSSRKMLNYMLILEM